MATFQVQLEDISGGSSVDTAAMSDWLTAGARTVLDILSPTKLERVVSNQAFTNTLDVEGKKILSVVRRDDNHSSKAFMPCRKLDPSLMGRVSDTNYMEAASESDPAYIIQGDNLNTYPASNQSSDSRVVYINTAITVAYGDSSIDNFPDEAEQAVVQKRIEFLEFEAKVLGSNQERELELANLRVEKLDIEERIKGVQSEQLTNTNSLLREQRDLKKSIFDTDVSILDIETASAVALEINEMKKLDIIEEASKKKYELQKEALDAEIAIHEEGTAAFQDATNQRNILEAQRTADVKLQSKARSDLEAKQAELVKQAKLELAESTLNGLSTLAQIAEDNQLVSAKKAFQIQKAISITQATIQGVVAVQKTLSEPALPFPANVITASAIGITSAANVAAIAAKKFDAGGGGSAPSVGGGGASTPSAGGGGAPQFNTVGTSGFNQVAGSIAEQNQEPVKAYVVSTDVTSQQSLDRNSREKSSF